MSRTVTATTYYYIYDHGKEDMVWYSPASADPIKCNHNLINAIDEAKRILRANPDADIEIDGHVTDMCNGFEDGNEMDFRVSDKDGFAALETKLKGGKA